MHPFQPTTTLPILLLATLTVAHIKLEQPVPYGAATLNTEPLESTGADWPCKQRPGGYDITKWNTMPIGAEQTMKFKGMATHGGGTCQISLTKDTPPIANSVFKVIKSIEGGCPSTAPGNAGTDPNGYGADEFKYTIPNGVSPANYTLAWTWFNKIGNREMYMNCAPVTVTSSSNSRVRRGMLAERTDSFDGLPTMFRANSGNGCSTAPSGTVLEIPKDNVGSAVQKIGNDPLTPPVGNCGGDATPEKRPAQDVAQNPDAVDVAPTPPAPMASQTALSASSPTSTLILLPQPSAPAASQASPAGPASPPAPVASPPPAAAAPPAQPASQPSQATPPMPAPSTSPAAAPAIPGTTTGPCSEPGKSLCSPDMKMWGTCMLDHTVIFQAVAAGTKCDPKLGIEVAL